MNFNHLFTAKELLLASKLGKCGCCYWIPVSEGQATAARNITVQMYCKNCNNRTSVFMHVDEYKKHEKVITQEVNRVKTSK